MTIYSINDVCYISIGCSCVRWKEGRGVESQSAQRLFAVAMMMGEMSRTLWIRGS